jgi:hypothetical protein
MQIVFLVLIVLQCVMAYNDGLQLQFGTASEVKLVLNVSYHAQNY